MAKLTILDMVQDILSDLDSDDVNTINETVESTQVAQILKTTYFNIIDGKDWPFLYQFFQLIASSTTLLPNYMTLPENITEVKSIKYNKRTLTDTRDRVEDVVYKTPEAFLDLVNHRVSSSTKVLVITDPSGIKLNILNNVAPSYYTSFDDETIVFDSYDSAVDIMLQTNKVQGYGKIQPVFTVLDSFIPELPVQMFSYLLNEAKSTAFIILKQSANQKAEQHSISQRRRMSQQAWRVSNGISYPNYGRK